MVGKATPVCFSSVAASFQKDRKRVVVEEGATVTLAGLCGELGDFFFPFLSARKFEEVAGWRAVKSLHGL